MRPSGNTVRSIGLTLVVLLGACQPSAPIMPVGHGPIVYPCAEAYRTAVIVHAANNDESDFDDAIATCHSLSDWAQAVGTNPEALGSEAMTFLRDRCRKVPALVTAMTCESIVGSSWSSAKP
jgi:hypothetical protein